jgi:DNA-binding transcriptional ArsR family regulator
MAISPLAELLGTLMMATRRGGTFTGSRLGPVEQRVLTAFEHWRDADPVRAGFANLVSHTKYLPDFVGIAPPTHGTASLEEELGTLADLGRDQVREQLRAAAEQTWKVQDLGWMDTPDLAPRIRSALAEAWDLVIAPDWDRRRTVLHREIAYRSALVAEHGWAGALADMGRNVSWENPGILLLAPRVTGTTVVAEHLCFVPITQTDGVWTCDGPVGTGLVYGARGVRAGGSENVRDGAADGGTGAGGAGTMSSGALGRLLGNGRSSILLALDLPATPSQLHGDLDLALGTVGGHLRVLADAGLVVSARLGREVYYRRRRLGEDLVARGT